MKFKLKYFFLPHHSFSIQFSLTFPEISWNNHFPWLEKVFSNFQVFQTWWEPWWSGLREWERIAAKYQARSQGWLTIHLTKRLFTRRILWSKTHRQDPASASLCSGVSSGIQSMGQPARNPKVMFKLKCFAVTLQTIQPPICSLK